MTDYTTRTNVNVYTHTRMLHALCTHEFMRISHIVPARTNFLCTLCAHAHFNHLHKYKLHAFIVCLPADKVINQYAERHLCDPRYQRSEREQTNAVICCQYKLYKSYACLHLCIYARIYASMHLCTLFCIMHAF